MRLPEYPEYVEKIISRFADAGEDAYIVGGCLRDFLLGKTPDDFDMATSALPEKTMEIFKNERLLTNGLKHGTVTVIISSHPVEITTFRIDGSYTDSRHPDAVRFTSKIEEDLSRRDFTVNAMAYNRKLGFVDPFGGQADLERRILRAVGDPERRFDEDALRIMRAFRFAAQLCFDIDAATLDGAHKKRGGLANIARERIGVEFVKLITSPSPAESLVKMIELKIMPYVCKGINLTSAILNNIEKMPRTPESRLGFLLSATESDLARAILRELRVSTKIQSGALAVAEGARMSVDSESAAGKFAARFGARAFDAAYSSELLGNSPVGTAKTIEKWSSLPHTLGDLAIGGADVKALGAVGKEIGEILEYLLDAVISDPNMNTEKTLIDLAEKQIIKVRESEHK